MLAFPSAPKHVRHLLQGLGERAKVNFLPPRQNSTHLSDFFQIPQNPPRTLPVHGVIHILKSYLGFLFGHFWMTHPPRANAWTPALMLHLTNPCAKRKVLCLTKPKGKIYETKSLGHYITHEVKMEKKKKKKEKTEKFKDLVWEEKIGEIERDGYTNCNWGMAWNWPSGLGNKTRNWRWGRSEIIQTSAPLRLAT